MSDGVAHLAELIEASRGDRLRVLIVGAGVAGSALAGLLNAVGLHPVLVERSPPDTSTGYMLGVLPVVEPVLRRLDAVEAYRTRSLPVHRYRIRGRRGQLLREYDFDATLADRCYRGITRADLLEVLGPRTMVCHATTITELTQGDETVRATLRTEERTIAASFDLVVGADGLHSTVRSLVLDDGEVSGVDTGVAGWAAWMDGQPESPVAFEETWGTTAFVGRYPVPGRTGVFVGGRAAVVEHGPAAFARTAHPGIDTSKEAGDGAALAAVATGDGYLWRIEDRRAARWRCGQVVLLGDAAVGFLPTAGAGAAMAIESAGVLASVLRDARADDQVVERLAVYERCQRPRCESAQDASRDLARIMFPPNPAIGVARDLLVRLLPARLATRPLRRLLDETPLTAPAGRGRTG